MQINLQKNILLKNKGLTTTAVDFKKYKKLIHGMVINDLKKEYIGSFLGFFWAFVQPLSMIFVLWFVFEIGFRSKPVENIPFVLWISSGLLPWFFISNSLSQTTNSIVSQAFLVKKISFPVIILPFIKVLSQLTIHLVMMLFLALAFIMYGIGVDIYWLQLFYYIVAASFFLSGVGLLLSSFVVFIKDIKNLLPIVIQFSFWGTPIFWSLSKIPQKYHIYMKLNPFEFLIQGYRDSIIEKVWFWDRGFENLYFWSLSLILFFLGLKVFKKLRTHFVDVL